MIRDHERVRQFCFLFAILSTATCALAADPAATSRRIRTTAKTVRIRSVDGDILCTVRKGALMTAIGRHEDGERIEVNANIKGCPKQGFVYANYVKPILSDDTENNEAEVESAAVTLRSAPNIGKGTYRCALPKGARLLVTDDSPTSGANSGWVKIKLKEPRPGCPEEGFLDGDYLKPTDSFEDLPVTSGTRRRAATGRNTEADVPTCTGNCERIVDPAAANREDLKRVADEANKSRGPFIDELRKMIKDRKYKPQGLRSNRGLVQMPLDGRTGTIGPCGSHHYGVDKPIGIDAYANPLTACSMTAFAQEWKRSYCPDRAGCTLSWGDISHATRPFFNTHRSHTDGLCFDVRPPIKGGFADAGRTFRSPNYDKAKAKDLVALAKAMGADTSQLFFNDTSIGTKPKGLHDNHIHICFPNNEKTRDTCENLRIDPAVCPELQ